MEPENIKNGYKKLGNVDGESVSLVDDANSSRSQLINASVIEEFEEHGGVTYLEGLEDLPQGRHLGIFSTVVLFISRILGSGIFSISSGIYQDCGGSPALFFCAWIVASILAFSGLYVYLEMGSLIPRSGGTKVFLEVIYKNPRMLACVLFSIYSVMFGFNASNVLIFGEYALHSFGIAANQLQIRLTGLAFLVLAGIIHGSSVSLGVRVQNIMGSLKLTVIGIMILVASYVIFLPKSVNHIESNLQWSEFFQTRSSVSVASFTSAVIKGSFAFSGWNTVHNVSSEIKEPVRTFKIAGPLSLGIITITYLLTNLVYLIVIPPDELMKGGTLVGSYLFESVLGYRMGKQFLTFAVALCAGGNIFVVIYTTSRSSQEVFREGFLPFSKYMAANWSSGSPSGTIILSVILSIIVVFGPPDGDIFDYIIAMEGYPVQIYTALTALGIFIIRRRYPELRAPIRSSLLGTCLVLLITGGMIFLPLVEATHANPRGLQNWIPYPYVAIFCLLCSFIYWLLYFVISPNFLHYELVEDKIYLEDGLTVKRWAKVPLHH